MLPVNNTSASAYLNLKMRDLISVFQRLDAMERKKNFFKSVLTASENPATKAARTLAIKNSGQLLSLRKELKNPSFESGDSFQDLRKPSLFTTDYQLSDDYVYENELPEENPVVEWQNNYAIRVYKNNDEEEIAYIILAPKEESQQEQ